MTLQGAVVGTPAYMPPEQAQGLRCDARTDVYALGATLYELMTGHPPFEGPEPLAVLDRVRSEHPVPPRRFNPGIHPEVETIIARAMEKSPERRYASAKEFSEDLRRHLAGEPIHAKPARALVKAIKWAKRHRAATAAAGALLAVALALATTLTIRASRFRGEIGVLLAAADAAERENDVLGMLLNERLVETFDLEPYASRLVHEGTVAIDSNPRGAEVFLFRYVEGRDRRPMPRPYSVAGGRRDTTLGLDFSGFNRPGVCPPAPTKVPSGLYLLVLRKEGFRDVRVPVLVGRGTEFSETVRLYTDEQVGKDFVYVPAGKFILGGDPDVALAEPRTIAETGDFFIGRHEVTLEEYLEFLNAMIARDGVEEAQKRVPRTAENAGHYWHISPDAKAITPPEWANPKDPAFGISWYDAKAYCEWKSEATKRRTVSSTSAAGPGASRMNRSSAAPRETGSTRRMRSR